MSRSYRPLAFTSSVIDAQVAYGSRAALERLDRTHPGPGGPRADPDDGPAQLNRVRDPLTGNLAHDSRAAIIFMDYARQARLKDYGHARIADLRRTSHGATSEAVGAYRAKVEREVRIDVSAYDWNCPQHITPRFSAEELAPVLGPRRQRVTDLEAENARLREAQRLGSG